MRALADLRGALSLAHRGTGDWEPDCLAVSAVNDPESLRRLFAAFGRHEAWLSKEGRLEKARQAKARSWMELVIEAEFGRQGLALAKQSFLRTWSNEPFTTARRSAAALAIVTLEDPSA